VNPAAGVSDAPITMEDINAALKAASEKVITIIDGTIKAFA
jgi:purine nucleoside phosphorylase